MAAVLKTAVPQGTEGSNPSLSANFKPQKARNSTVLGLFGPPMKLAARIVKTHHEELSNHHDDRQLKSSRCTTCHYLAIFWLVRGDFLAIFHAVL
jgi:hypothetical protein